MTDTQLRDEVMTFFLAGYETTSLVLAWTWYLLSLHPDVHARLLSERHAVAAGTIFTLSPWSVQRDPRFHEEPERFLPERWTGGLAARLPKFAYFPFGGGSRLCIGKSFALLETSLVLATVAQRFMPRLLPTPPVVLERV